MEDVHIFEKNKEKEKERKKACEAQFYQIYKFKWKQNSMENFIEALKGKITN